MKNNVRTLRPPSGGEVPKWYGMMRDAMRDVDGSSLSSQDAHLLALEMAVAFRASLHPPKSAEILCAAAIASVATARTDPRSALIGLRAAEERAVTVMRDGYDPAEFAAFVRALARTQALRRRLLDGREARLGGGVGLLARAAMRAIGLSAHDVEAVSRRRLVAALEEAITSGASGGASK